MKYLLDTMVVSDAAKRRRNSALESWLASVSARDLFISVITLGEIAKGVAMLSQSPQRKALQAWIDVSLPAAFGDRVLDIDIAVAREWGALQARLKRTLPAADSLIAATARVHGLTVVTRNLRDFSGLGAPLHDPWS